MKRYGEEIKISDELMDTIGSYMDDDIREDVNADLAPCTAEEFLSRYLELDPDFEKLLEIEFDLTVK